MPTTAWIGAVFAALILLIAGLSYLWERIRLARETPCGFYGIFGLGPCMCMDRANHEPGGVYYQPGREPGPIN